jgi:hypothetical protein
MTQYPKPPSHKVTQIFNSPPYCLFLLETHLRDRGKGLRNSRERLSESLCGCINMDSHIRLYSSSVRNDSVYSRGFLFAINDKCEPLTNATRNEVPITPNRVPITKLGAASHNLSYRHQRKPHRISSASMYVGLFPPDIKFRVSENWCTYLQCHR